MHTFARSRPTSTSTWNGAFAWTLAPPPTSAPPSAVGLEVQAIHDGSFAHRCGMAAGDLLLGIGGVRIHSIGELWAVLAVRSEPATTVTWARGRERIEAVACLKP